MCFETLDDLLREQNGILRTSDALARGITKSQFYEYVNSAKLEKPHTASMCLRIC